MGKSCCHYHTDETRGHYVKLYKIDTEIKIEFENSITHLENSKERLRVDQAEE